MHHPRSSEDGLRSPGVVGAVLAPGTRGGGGGDGDGEHGSAARIRWQPDLDVSHLASAPSLRIASLRRSAPRPRAEAREGSRAAAAPFSPARAGTVRTPATLPALAATRALPPPSSPLHLYPSPLAESHVASVRDLLQRTYSSVNDALYYTPTDRIARNFTLTAQGLTMRTVGELLARGGAGLSGGGGSSAAFGPSATSGGGGGGGGGGGFESSGAAEAKEDGARGPRLRLAARSPSPSRATAFPEPTPAHALPTAGNLKVQRSLLEATSRSLGVHDATLATALASPVTSPARVGAAAPLGAAAKVLSPHPRMGSSASAALLGPASGAAAGGRAAAEVAAATAALGFGFSVGRGSPVLGRSASTPAFLEETAALARPLGSVSGAASLGSDLVPFTPRTEDRLVAEAPALYWEAVDSVADDATLAPLKSAWEDGVLDRLGVSEGPAKVWLVDELDEDGLSRFARKRPGNHLTVDERTGEALLSTGASPSAMVEHMFGEMEAEYRRAVKVAMLEYDLKSADPRHHHGLVLHAVDSARYVHPPAASAESLHVDRVSVALARRSLARRLFANEGVLSTLLDLWFDPVRKYHTLRLLDLGSLDFRSRLPAPLPDFHRVITEAIDDTRRVLRGQWHKESIEAIASFMLELKGDADHAAEAASDARKGAGAGSPGAAAHASSSSSARQAAVFHVFPAERDFVRAQRALRAMSSRGLDDIERRERALADWFGLPAPSSRTPGRSLPPLGSPSSSSASAAASTAATTFSPETPEEHAMMMRLMRARQALASSVGLEGTLERADLISLRLDGTLDAAAVLMGRLLRSVIYFGLADYRRFLEQFLPTPEEERAAAATAAAAAAAAAAADSARAHALGSARDTGSARDGKGVAAALVAAASFRHEGAHHHDLSHRPHGEHSAAGAPLPLDTGLPPLEDRTPALSIALALEYGEGGKHLGNKPIIAHAVHAPAPAAAAASTVGGKGKPGAGPTAGAAKGGATGAGGAATASATAGGAAAGSAVPVSAAIADPSVEQPERGPPITEVNLRGTPRRGDDVRGLWVGHVSIVFDPDWETIESELIRIAHEIVEAGEDFPRAEVEIHQFSSSKDDEGKSDTSGGAATGPSSTGALRRAGPESASALSGVGAGASSSSSSSAITAGGSSAGADSAYGAGGSSSAPTGTLSAVTRLDARVDQVRHVVRRLIQHVRELPDRLRARFDKFTFLFAPDTKAKLLGFSEDPANGVRQYREELRRWIKVMHDIEATCKDREVFGFVEVDASALKQLLRGRVRVLVTALLCTLREALVSTCQAMHERFGYLERRLRYVPRLPDLIVEHQQFVETVSGDLMALEDVFYGLSGATDMAKFLFVEALEMEAFVHQESAVAALGPPDAATMGMGGGGGAPSGPRARMRRGSLIGGADSFRLSEDQQRLFGVVRKWPERIRDARAFANSVLEKEHETAREQLRRDVDVFEATLADAKKRVAALDLAASLPEVAQVLVEIRALRKVLEDSMNRADDLNRLQSLLNVELVDWNSGILETLERLGPHERLWECVSQFVEHRHRWYHSALKDVNPEDVEKQGETAKAASIRSLKELREDAAGPRAVAQSVREESQKFLMTDLPLLALVANPGIKERHWETMEKIVGHSVPHHSRVSLQELLHVGLERRVPEIEETCVNAQKEFSLEKALERMQEEWGPLEIDLKAHKGSHILTGGSVDEVQALLDDHIVKSQTMSASRYAKPLLARLKDWTAALTEIQNVLDQWVKVQGQWMYLEPIFSSEDIMHQMPEEGRRFRVVDGTWRDLMRGAVADPRALHAFRQPGMLDRLREANQLLDEINKGLNSYLETKRLYFPRFFFLSNDELLEILSETKDPLRVQPFLKKCFEAIKSLEFDKDLNILAMFSEEDERVDLEAQADGRKINPKDARGNVEVWLDWVESSMRRSVARSVDQSVTAYFTTARSQWVRDWPGQAVLAASQTHWTLEVEAAIRAGGARGLAEYAQKLAAQISEVILMVRGNLSKLERKTLSALTVLDVHARDVTFQMAEAGVSLLTDFDWNSQLRYYWKDDGYSTRTGLPGSLQMKMINAVLLYANEYLGNSTRLVITPLTDRCYRTLMGAVHLGLGGAPEGPAGTGKTETTKDLAKAAGMMCVVFNCSDQLGVEEMAKFFKGLASSGAWACFDEFNRIDIEVLSVVAQQVIEIQRAIRERKERFVFAGTEIKLSWTANVFITMNPGYAGRSELPDNLKALFRSVAMMVPDYAMIAEIILYSQGYLEAKAMARKIVATYKLCSEQLSSQDHYDYGMRAVMAVLWAAGNLKRNPSTKDLPEDVLVLRAIIDVNLPKFLTPDIPLFQGIVQDLFPGVHLPPPDRELMETAMRAVCAELNLQPEAVLLEKTFQVYEMMLVRHGYMCVGLPWSGKTSLATVLQGAMQALHDEHPDDERWKPIHIVRINPKSITLKQLYGRMDDVTKEWSNGVLADKFSECATGKVGEPGDRQWLCFDGPVDAIWIENMNTVLDDNKKLCLNSGQIIPMSSTMSMVFETRDLAAASPATVSRCGMIYLEPHVLGWKPIVKSWLDHLAEDNPRFPFRAAHPSDATAAARQAAERKAFDERMQAEMESGATTATATGAAADDATAAAEGGAGGGGGAGGAHVAKRGKGKRKKAGGLAFGQEDPRPFTIDANQRRLLDRLFDWVIDPCLVLLRKELSEYCPTQDTTLVWTLTNVFETTLAQVVEAAARGSPGAPGTYKVGSAEIRGKAEFSEDDLKATFFFALVWSVAGTVTEAGRQRFDEFLRNLMTDESFLSTHPLAVFFRLKGWAPPTEPITLGGPVQFPTRGTVYDQMYCAGDGRWRSWESMLPNYEIGAGAAFSDIIVPTTATLQFDHLLPLLAMRRRRVLVCGPTGTGKSVYTKRFLLKTLPKSEYMSILVGFSAQTSALQTQSQVDPKLDRRRKGVFGPPPGTTCILFVDDLNMPTVEKYGAQPPIELLRQMVDSGGWYNLEDNTLMQFEDVLLMAAMGKVEGGRNAVCPRMLRHFNALCFTELNEGTLSRIFSSMMSWFVRSASFSDDIARLDRTVVQATMDVYSKASEVLRPTPAKSHYTFNLRDFSKVIQGVLLVTPDSCPSAQAFVRLWMHECLRVFHDRLTTEEDRTWIVQHLRAVVAKQFNQNVDVIGAHLPALKVAITSQSSGGAAASAAPSSPVARGGAGGGAAGPAVADDDIRMVFWGDYAGSGTKKFYSEILDSAQLVGAVEGALAEYNGQSKKPMDLVPFLFFLEHVSRISRILKMPGGHALLVGVGGSGRQSATRLATFMAGYKLMQVELSKSYGVKEWQDDLKAIMREAGTGLQPIVFLFSDTQIKWEGMVEDINNILNSGEVPNLFAADERAEIYEKVGPLARAAGLGKDLPPAELYAYFVERMKANLHIVLATSPIGDAFRDRLRKFPSLVNCTTIDWFTAWPADALEAVARKHLSHLRGISAERQVALARVCQHFHRSAQDLSEDFRSQMRRYNYVTPTSYLELLSLFKKLLAEKSDELTGARNRYLVGLGKLEDATKQVSQLQRELEDMQPVLAQSQRETAELMVVISAKLPGAEELRVRVRAEADVATEDAAKVAAAKAEVDADLAEAMPALNSAIAALDTLRPEDIKFIRALTNPSDVIRKVCGAVLVMLREKPDKMNDPAGGMKKVDDYWGPAKRLLADHADFLRRLKEYDKDHIDPVIIGKIRKEFIDDPDFTVDRATQASTAAAGMCAWVRAMDTYERVAKVVAPKMAARDAAEAELAVKRAALQEKESHLKAVEDELASLQAQYEAAVRRKAELEANIELCRTKLIRAEQLIGGLGGEKARWTQQAEQLRQRLECLTGNVLLAAGIISYLGAFTIEFRNQCIADWLRECERLGIPIGDPESEESTGEADEAEPAGEGDEAAAGGGGAGGGGAATPAPAAKTLTLASVLGDPIKIRQWRLDGLPTDGFSTDNGVIVSYARRWPLMIDPQGQANKWVKTTEKANNVLVLKQTDPNFLRSMENAVQFGQPVVLENVNEDIDPSLEPILLKVLFKQGASWCIRIGDATVEYDDRFKLYITTKLRNPHYLPEIATKVTLLNFMITPAGLQDQLLGVVVAEERPDLEEAKSRMLLQSAENKRMLAELEDRILKVLSSSSGNILEDETAISVLNESKVLSNEITEKQKVAEVTEREIDATRSGYTPVAAHAARLFFVTADMGNIDPMYQNSMSWFTSLFVLSIRNSKRSDNLATRITSLNDYFTFSLYKNVCRSLFEKDKLVFSFLLCIKIMVGRGEVDPNEWYFLLTGGVGMDNPHPNPASEWLTDKSWGEAVRLSHLTAFAGLHEDIAAHAGAWKRWYDSEEPHRADLPGKWGQLGRLTRLQRILVLRCIRPDKVILAIQDFVGAQMGDRFLKPPPFDLRSCHEDSSPGQPLVFVLSPGSDPMAALLSFADGMRVQVSQISLGKGQGVFAEEMIAHGRRSGSWVVLQNCHLASSWMPALEKICEELADAHAGKAGLERPHPNFRLWLTSYPSNDFPVSILQNGIKMTNEPPKGLRNNLQRSYLSDPISDAKFFNGVRNAQPFRRMLFGLCFFHAMVQERRQFGPLGWNISYEFNESDLRISVMQLGMFLDDPAYSTPGDPAAVPYATLRYLTGECNYGGRVTDDKDRRALMSILNMFYTVDIHRPSHPVSSAHEWTTPPESCTEYKHYCDFIDGLPVVPVPEVFGLHSNATITKDLKDTNQLFTAVLMTERGGGGGGGGGGGKGAAKTKSKDETIAEVAADVLSKLHPDFDLEEIGGRYPVVFSESMNTVLRQELARFNRLLGIIRSSLVNIQKALRGLVVMSATLEELGGDLFFGRVPTEWKGRSYPSLKPLAGYVADLVERMSFFDRWIEHGTPNIFWISGFFFTQSFLTGALQNYARRYTVPIDEIGFDIEPLNRSVASIRAAPTDGVYIWGMFFDGCRWDSDHMMLGESEPKQLFSPAPVMWLQPKRSSDLREFTHYNCPVYKTSERRGTLSTTGHSTNFVMMMKLATDQSQDHWVRRGVSLLLALDD